MNAPPTIRPKLNSRVWNGKVIEPLRAALPGRKKTSELINCLNALLTWDVARGNKPHGEIQISDSRTTLLLPGGLGTSSGTGVVQRMRVKTVYGACLSCVPWDGITEGAGVYVAKPAYFGQYNSISFLLCEKWPVQITTPLFALI